MTMRRNMVRSMGGVLAVGIAMSAFAQDANVAALPPLPVTQPAVSVVPTMPAQLPPSAATAPMPAVALPTMPATQPAAPVAAAPAPAPAAATSLPVVPVASPTPASLAAVLHPDATMENPEAKKIYSYGTSNVSILFLPVQIDRMKTAIHNYENSAKPSAVSFVAPEPTSIAAPAETINEPAAYPVFYLASIAYHTPSDWSLWISGHKITSRKNDTDLTVISVSPDSASFSWAPSYAAVLNQRHAQRQFAPVDAVKHRLLKNQEINLSDTSNTVTFTLHPNQSFAVGYFSMFEGYMATPAMPAIVAGAPTIAVDTSPSDEDAAAAQKAAESAPAIPSTYENRTVMPSAKDLLGGVSSGGDAAQMQQKNQPAMPGADLSTPPVAATPNPNH